MIQKKLNNLIDTLMQKETYAKLGESLVKAANTPIGYGVLLHLTYAGLHAANFHELYIETLINPGIVDHSTLAGYAFYILPRLNKICSENALTRK